MLLDRYSLGIEALVGGIGGSGDTGDGRGKVGGNGSVENSEYTDKLLIVELLLTLVRNNPTGSARIQGYCTRSGEELLETALRLTFGLDM